MKTLYFSLTTALAACTLTILPSADAQPNRFGRAGSIEKADAVSEIESQASPAYATTIKPSKSQPKKPPVMRYPKYRLIDLGTLGGPNSSQAFPAVNLNNRGEVIAFSSISTPDPNPFTLQDDLIWHGILSNANGVVRDLGALPGTNQSLATTISANGLIAGASENGLWDDTVDFPQLRPVWWDRARNIHDLGTFGGNTGFAGAVNSHGQVVGYATNMISENPDVASFMNGFLPAGQQVRAFLWQGGSLRDLGTLGGNDAAAQAINESGDIGGLSYTGTQINDTTGLPTVHPFLWHENVMQDVGSLGGTLSTPGSFAFGPFGNFLNQRGDMVGTSMLAGDEVWHAFFWSKGKMTDLGTLGGSASEALSLNNLGQVVGRAVVSDAPLVRHGFLWEKGRMTDLGTVAPCTRGTATSINSAGQIVGLLGVCTDNPDDLTYFSAFYVEKGKPMVDLNTLITPPSPIHLDDASFINERGEIAGGGLMPDGTTRAVLLVPTNR